MPAQRGPTQGAHSITANLTSRFEQAIVTVREWCLQVVKDKCSGVCYDCIVFSIVGYSRASVVGVGHSARRHEPLWKVYHGCRTSVKICAVTDTPTVSRRVHRSVLDRVYTALIGPLKLYSWAQEMQACT